MYSNRPPPPYPELRTVALLGKGTQFKNFIGNTILNNNYAFTTTENLTLAQDRSFNIINTPDFFDEKCNHADQQIIDFMALAHPGPDLFLLAIDPENIQSENVMAQVRKLQDTFGEDLTAHLVIILRDRESVLSLNHLKNQFSIGWVDNNLARECKQLCCGQQPFLFDYKKYSQEVVMARRKVLENRLNAQPMNHQPGADAGHMGSYISQHANAAPNRAALQGNRSCRGRDNLLNIVLLGLTGTGKSASANTILAASGSDLDPSVFFQSSSSSMPITVQCESKITVKPFGQQVRLVDTPDFFNDELQNSQAHIAECRKYCQPRMCVVLLVVQLGRFTDDEQEIVQKLENILGWRIRESTIILLTHGDDLKGSVEEYIRAYPKLSHLVSMCGNRYHIFNNNSKDTKQVMELIKKIPDYKDIFPKFQAKKIPANCCVC